MSDHEQDTISRKAAIEAVEANRHISPDQAIRAIAALPSVGVKVKQLEWFEVEKSRFGGKYTADGYTIRYIEGLWLLDFAGESKQEWRFPTLEAAKAAAQADYEARILSALAVQPAPDAAPMGWIIGDGQGQKWRCAFDLDNITEWTADRNKALKFATREDAEAYSQHDEDAWLVVPVPLPAALDVQPAPDVDALVEAIVVAYKRQCELQAQWKAKKANPASINLAFVDLTSACGDASDDLQNALAALALKGGQPQTDYERKLAALKEDFPNGI